MGSVGLLIIMRVRPSPGVVASVALAVLPLVGGFAQPPPGSKLARAGSAAALPADLDSPGLVQLLSKQRDLRDWASAQASLWAASTREALVQPVHYNIVLAAMSDAAEWEQALMLLEHMPAASVSPDVYSYSAAISACARARKPDQAVGVFKRMCASDVTPNRVAFNAALDACQRAGRHSEVLALFGAMAAYGVQPGAWAYSSAIDALSRGGQWRRALDLLADLEQVPCRMCAVAAPGTPACGRACFRTAARLHPPVSASIPAAAVPSARCILHGHSQRL